MAQISGRTIAGICVSLSVLATLFLAWGCTPPAASETPETVAEKFLSACHEGDRITAGTLTVAFDLPTVVEYDLQLNDRIQSETGSLDEFKQAYADRKDARKEQTRLEHEKPFDGIDLEIDRQKTRIAKAEAAFPLLFELQETGLMTPMLGTWRFKDMTGTYLFEVATYTVVGKMWLAKESDLRPGPYSIKLGRIRVKGKIDGNWRVFEILDATGHSVFRPSDVPMPVPKSDEPEYQ